MATHTIHSYFKGVAEYFTPLLNKSNFKTKGVLTPEEFVEAGDQLVYKCRTWQWNPGKEGLVKPYLPKEKQFLITRNVPSLKRASDYALNDAKEEVVESKEGDGDGDGWVSTHIQDTKKNKPEQEELDTLEIQKEEKTSNGSTLIEEAKKNDGEDGEDDIPDMDDFEEDNLVEEDPGLLLTDNIKTGDNPKGDHAPGKEHKILRVEEPEDNIERTRTYDISITYDKYYQTPRIFLFGYDKNRQALTPEQIMQDISADHAHKTVTVDPHPHLEVPHASIHPCRHAPVMLRICERMEEENVRKTMERKASDFEKQGEKPDPKKCKLTEEESQRCAIRVDQYLFLFLKFISSVIPTIEYDYTF